MTTVDPRINISVTFRHTDSTDALKSYATEKVDHLLQKFITHDADVNVVLDVEKKDQTAEIIVRSKGYDFEAKATTIDLYSAIDKAVDNLNTQLRRKKDKVVSSKHQSPSISSVLE